jgi:uncharacterized membrane protein
MNHLRFVLVGLLLAGLVFGLAAPALAQEGSPGALSISTAYPSMVIGVGETITLKMDVHSSTGQTVALGVAGLPKDWTAEFRGGGRVIRSVYVEKDSTSQVDLRVTPPDNAAPGTYNFTVVARGNGARAEFSVEFVIKDKVPARLSFETDFPTLRGGSESPFNFSATLKNDGDDDIAVTLSADVPRGLRVTFKSVGKDITNLPTDIKAGGSSRIDITAEPLTALAVGSYPITVLAQGENIEATLLLTAEVVGQPQLTITTPDSRLSGDAYIGRSNPIKLVLRNSGNSPAVGIKLTVSSPAGWTVTLDPGEVVEVPAGGEVEVTANVQPADKAIAGDYMLTFRAQPKDGASKSADFRVTVRTSTLWGVAGIGLIAVAVGVVALAVSRFGRR